MSSLLNSPQARLALYGALGLLLSACSLPRSAQLAAPQQPAQFKQSAPAVGAVSGASDTEAIPAAWWSLYQDPTLDALQAQLVIGNENLKAALAQVDAARAVLGQVRAAQQPQLGGSFNVNRADTGNGAQTNARADLAASWELDLWGRLKQASLASEARLQASQNDLAALRLSAQATLTQSYFSLRVAEAQQALIARNISAFQRSLDMTVARYQAGVVAATDVLQAETQLKNAQVQSLDTNNQRALAEHAIAVLLGQAPAQLSLKQTAKLPLPPSTPELLPSTLLQRRPDINAAERRVAAAQAQVGEAALAFFPSVSITAGAGLRGPGLHDLFNAPTLLWSLGPALAQKILDGGARDAVHAQAIAQAEQAGAVYRQLVLQAFQEVEDNLFLSRQLQAQAGLQAEALSAALRNLDITQEQYRVGTVSFLNVVVAQTAALNSERNLLDLQSRQLTASNQLLKNIAGSW
ncbi:efflux transporter outer membrane subunit [Paucibacter sp. TC2R-5]|uniref:efflux transporter outer membrane subunit n=1 Tax=Paucibacter sp. TC2R-5 TaxID=2893555 RepID=UPI0021E361D5|nr:efflux transporter outer membrane subunit [Paucibacter sp. TC2R-5]MCV2361262.1 efflux transporter outer membrane subunit [Paucibacter sp. TC2R-5]